MKATLFLASLFAVSGLCSPIDDKKNPTSNHKKLGSSISKEFTDLKIDPSYAPVSDLWSSSGARFLEEIKKKDGKQYVITDITSKKWKAKVEAACHAKPECVGFYVNTAEDDGPPSPGEKAKKYRFGYLVKTSISAKDFEKQGSSSGVKGSSSSGSKKSSSSGLKESSSDENDTSTSDEGETYPYGNIRGAVAYKKKTSVNSNSNSE